MADTNLTIIAGQGGGVGPSRTLPGGLVAHFVNVTFAAPGTYATGGQPLVLTAEGLFGKFVGVTLLRYNDGVRYWDWNGDTAAPKLVARDAFQTEEGAGTDVSAVSLPAVIYMKV